LLTTFLFQSSSGGAQENRGMRQSG